MKKYEYDSKEGYGLLEAYGQDLKRRGASQNTIRTYQSSVRLFYFTSRQIRKISKNTGIISCVPSLPPQLTAGSVVSTSIWNS